MKFVFNTNGKVCAQSIEVEVENSQIKQVRFHGGCPGNHAGIERLVAGMQVDEVIRRLSGIRCGGRPTSCPDQLACALKEISKKI